MSQAPSMPVFTDALIGDTLHLSAEEFGAYCLLLFATWRNNGEALPDNASELAQICRVTPQRWRSHMRNKLLRFFDTSDGHWHQKRLEREWKNVQKKVEASRANGAMGGRPKEPNKNPPGSQYGTQPSGAGNLDQTQPQSTQSQSQKLASKQISDSLPSEWGESAASERAKRGLPEANLSAEWDRFLNKVGDEPTLERWVGWALKANGSAKSVGNGKANGGLPEQPWPQRCRSWLKGMRWDDGWGPPPGQPGCLAPADLVIDVLRQVADRQKSGATA